MFDQADFNIRCEWGLTGVEVLAPISDVVIIVDVLSFSTCVDVAVARQANVYPFFQAEQTAEQFAEQMDAIMASRDRTATYSLSPHSLLKIPAGTRLVLPSPNGSRLSTATGRVPTLAACLRNARAVARYAQALGNRIAVIPAGERWWQADGLRPALEDWVGAGAVIHYLDGLKSPEAQAAEAVFAANATRLGWLLDHIGSGRELRTEGFEQDVTLCAQLNSSAAVPRLIDGAYQNAAPLT